MTVLKTSRLAPLSENAPKNVVIFLHGLGDSGSGGLLDIGRVWQSSLPNTEFLCPDAPFAFDMAPPDFAGRQWFSLKEFTKEAILKGVKTAAPILNQFIDEVLNTRNLTADKISLVGFSQGTMMSLYVGLRREKQVACMLGYSGLLVDAENLIAERKSSPPVLLVHGELDNVVPFEALAEAERGLKLAKIDVTTLACPTLAHSIDNAGLAAGLKFLQTHLK